MHKRTLLVGGLVVVLAAVGVLWAADGPLTPIANLKGRTDANGYLLTTVGAATGSDGPLTPIGQLRGRTDANGYLLTTVGAATGSDGPLTPIGQLRGRTDANGYLRVVASGADLIVGTTGLVSAQGADIGTTNLVASAAAGLYEVCGWIAVTRAGSSSSTMPGVVIAFNNGNAQSITLIASSTGNTVNTFGRACNPVRSAAAQAITYATSGWASSGATSMQYEVFVTARSIY